MKNVETMLVTKNYMAYSNIILHVSFYSYIKLLRIAKKRYQFCLKFTYPNTANMITFGGVKYDK